MPTTQHNIDNNNALHVAACSANLFKKERAILVLDYLSKCGLDINSTNLNGESPLLIAANYKYPSFPELAERLLMMGADPNIVDNKGRTFLTVVRTKCKNKLVVRDALAIASKYGFDLDLLDEEDLIPLSKKYVKKLIVKRNLVTFNCFAKEFNSVLKKPLRVKKA
jgi:ankyrin repeat protein